ncbi:hypothetical protein F4814DRAFT_430053 [Daldinia grandis]|nr:hypothetical protein F4814DRAFT_430053 [Daldinia grandis]
MHVGERYRYYLDEAWIAWGARTKTNPPPARSAKHRVIVWQVVYQLVTIPNSEAIRSPALLHRAARPWRCAGDRYISCFSPFCFLLAWTLYLPCGFPCMYVLTIAVRLRSLLHDTYICYVSRDLKLVRVSCYMKTPPPRIPRMVRYRSFYPTR